MSEGDSTDIPRNPQREARKWLDLYRAGRYAEAAALTIEGARRNQEDSIRALEEFLQAREAARK